VEFLIYVIDANFCLLEFMASKHKFLKAGFLAYILNISVFPVSKLISVVFSYALFSPIPRYGISNFI